MTHYTLAYEVNDAKKFKEEVFTSAVESMREHKEEPPYFCHAISCNDEFGKLEKIEDIVQSVDLSADAALEKIEEILFK